MVPWDNPATENVAGFAEEWIVAVTIATEVPPTPTKSVNSQETFTAAMIMAAQQAVAEVILTRARDPRFPHSAAGVVLQPRQFSAVMRGLTAAALGHKDIWLEGMAGEWFPQHVEECLSTWRRVAAGKATPLVKGATHYYSPVSMKPPLSAPSWVSPMTPVVCAGVSSDYFRFFR